MLKYIDEAFWIYLVLFMCIWLYVYDFITNHFVLGNQLGGYP